MTKPIYITGGAYRNRSLIANAQRCVNLYLEKNEEASQSPVPFTLYTRPGLRKLTDAPTIGNGRCLYQDSTGQLFAVVGSIVYYVDSNFTMTAIGAIAPGRSTCSMSDNGTTALLVDGTTSGYQVDLQSKSYLTISDPAFYGADRVTYIRTVFALNRPGTNQFYISGSNAVTWDALDFGIKTSSADPLVSIAALNDQLWLLGTRQGEVWYWSGDALFPFQQLPGVIIEHGTCAKYSVAKTDKFLFWLSQDKDGRPMLVMGNAGYEVKRISTHALEAEIQKYTRWDDAIGYTYQMFGHVFYDIVFPTANRTWSYDLSTGEFSQYVSINRNGAENRMRGFLSAYVYNTNVMLDWQTGALYALDPDYFADDTDPIKCVRGFPHLGAGGQRVLYPGIVADMDVGRVQGRSFDPTLLTNPFASGFSSGFGPFYAQDIPQVSMRFSHDRGYTFGQRQRRGLGATGQYNHVLRWGPQGEARDGVFELEWAVPCATALNCAYLFPDPEVSET